jgi:hypothetical protein
MRTLKPLPSCHHPTTSPPHYPLGILTLVPLLGLIILLIVNQRATGVLQAKGYRVGLLGASLSQFDDRDDDDDEEDDE